jgi:hypothetical protein
MQNIVSLGCLSSCEEINTKVVATVTGTWTVRLLFNGMVLTKTFEATQGEMIKLANVWPEDLPLLMQLIKPDGMPVDDKYYQFKNKLTLSL